MADSNAHTLFVPIVRLQRCYPEQTDERWAGKRKRKRKKQRRQNVEERCPTIPRRDGPVTRAMSRRLEACVC